MTVSTKLPPYRVLPEPLLAFGDGRPDARHLHPLRGLLKFGPYSKSAFSTFRDRVRVATICPEDTQKSVFTFLKSLQQKHEPKERKNYLPAFPGFENVFGVPIHGAAGGLISRSLPTRWPMEKATWRPWEKRCAMH